MRQLIAITIISTIATSCTGSATKTTVTPTPTPPANIPSASPTVVVSADRNVAENVPPEFRFIDFRNFSYPLTWKRQTIRLENGHLEFFEDKIFDNAWFDLEDMYYADLNNDGKKEAVAQVHWVSCGVSCDGGSSLFYFYQRHGQKVRLVARIETGSLGYQECGLKTFELDHGTLMLETFQKCRFNGTSIKPVRYGKAEDPIAGKFGANSYTRFNLRFTGHGFSLQNREVFPWPRGECLNYEPAINVKG